MLEWLSRGALPVGMLMFAGMVAALVVRRARFRRAARDYPTLARKLGLTFRPSPHRRAIGTLTGRYRGYQVFVDPDEARRITVHFNGHVAVDFRTYETGRGVPRTMRTFYSGDRKFDAFFKTRHASDELARQLQGQARPSRLLEPFRAGYSRELKQLNVTSNGLSCVFDFGNPPHIPAAAVELMLAAMVELAQFFEPGG